MWIVLPFAAIAAVFAASKAKQKIRYEAGEGVKQAALAEGRKVYKIAIDAGKHPKHALVAAKDAVKAAIHKLTE